MYFIDAQRGSPLIIHKPDTSILVLSPNYENAYSLLLDGSDNRDILCSSNLWIYERVVRGFTASVRKRHRKDQAVQITMCSSAGIGAVILLRISLIATTNNESNIWSCYHSANASSTNLNVISTLTTATTSGNSGELNSTLIVALIGLAGVFLGALITGGVTIFQIRRATQLQREQLQIQYRQAQEIARLQ